VAAVPFWELPFSTTTFAHDLGAQSGLLAAGTAAPKVQVFAWVSTIVAPLASATIVPLALAVAAGGGGAVGGGGVTGCVHDAVGGRGRIGLCPRRNRI
jgi:hypothetical protein